MSGHLHIVFIKSSNASISGNQPDVLQMIRALHEIGQKIHFHCFYPERIHLELIQETCEEISFYCTLNEEKGLSYVQEQKEKQRLLAQLSLDDQPIICHGFDAMDTVSRLPGVESRKLIFRLFRHEPTYLLNLARVTPWGRLKISYLLQWLRVKNRFHQVLRLGSIASSIELPFKNLSIRNIPLFKGQAEPFFKEGQGSFCLFHGDLSKRENEYAAQWLLEHVFNVIEIPFVIAGKDPSDSLEQAAHVRMHTCLVSNPSPQEMAELIKKAQVVLMPVLIESTGHANMLESLLLGRHILVNNKAMQENPFAQWLEPAETPESFQEKTEQLFHKPFTAEEKESRIAGIESMGTDQSSAKALINLLN